MSDERASRVFYRVTLIFLTETRFWTPVLVAALVGKCRVEKHMALTRPRDHAPYFLLREMEQMKGWPKGTGSISTDVETPSYTVVLRVEAADWPAMEQYLQEHADKPGLRFKVEALTEPVETLGWRKWMVRVREVVLSRRYIEGEQVVVAGRLASPEEWMRLYLAGRAPMEAVAMVLGEPDPASVYTHHECLGYYRLVIRVGEALLASSLASFLREHAEVAVLTIFEDRDQSVVLLNDARFTGDETLEIANGVRRWMLWAHECVYTAEAGPGAQAGRAALAQFEERWRSEYDPGWKGVIAR